MDKEKLLQLLKNVPTDELPPVSKDESLYDYQHDPFAVRNDFELLGALPFKHSRDIQDSVMGIGFETLDRDTFDPDPVIELLGKTGVKYARCQTGWIKCEKQEGVFDFAWLDNVADKLLANGITPWFSVSFGNPLYTPNDYFAEQWKRYTDKMDIPGWARGYVGEVPMYHGEKAMKAFLRYVKELVNHFKGRVPVYEVWNEPEWFWMFNGNSMTKKLGFTQATRDYVEFVRQTSEVIREADPSARVTSVTASFGSSYIQELGHAGLGKYVDIHCFHYYGPEPDNMLNAKMEHLRTCLSVPGKQLTIWQGESGRASGKCAHVTHPSEYNQAKFACRRYIGDKAEGCEVSSLFTASNFYNYYADGSDQYYGVVGLRKYSNAAPDNGFAYEKEKQKLQRKLAYFTMQGLGALLEGMERDKGMLAYFEQPNETRQVEETMPYHVTSYGFCRKGVPVYALWRPGNVDLSHPTVEGKLRLLSFEPGTMENPIVIDPIRRLVYAIRDAQKVENGAECSMEYEVPRFPMPDYPVLVTDLSVFEDYLG